MDEEIRKILFDYLTSGNVRMRYEEKDIINGEKEYEIVLEAKGNWERWEEICRL